MSNYYSILKLQGKVQHYDWGGYTFLPELLGIKNEENRPFAEYWLGIHPSASAYVAVQNGWKPLQELIDKEPDTALSPLIHQKFGNIPYLLKVMDVREMLSIQVHPSKESAIAGFERENQLGIPLNAPHRNYKDQNHKPEAMLAISEFWLLHGFKQKEQLQQILEEVIEFQILLPLFRKEGLQSLYRFIMEMEQQSINDLLLPLVKREIRQKQEGLLNKTHPGWWVSKHFNDQPPTGDIDRGIFSIYFFNIVCLQPGEAIFQGAGLPHAYLEGQNIELMSNSDNVLRAGLTKKHIDVQELLANTDFTPIVPTILKGQNRRDGEYVFHFPVPDFSLTHLLLNSDTSFEDKAISPEIWVVIEGGVIINQQLVVKKGEAFIVFPGQSYQLLSSGKTSLYKAFVAIPDAYSQDEEN
jgi:mannose-6-phosphate isomerase